jgi:ABC-type glycerol-3-phosphate transport system permease component
MAVREMTAATTLSSTDTRADVWHPKRGIRWGVILRHAILISFCAFVLLPLFWVILMSFKSVPDGVHRYIWPKNFISPILTHYHWVLEKRPDVIQYFKNSVMVTLGTVAMATVTAVLAGYALAHLRTPGRSLIVTFLVASTFFPTRVTALIGIYNVQDSLGLINRTWGLIFPYTALSTAISIFIMRGIFQTIPTEIVDSSRIDGASSLRTLFGIMLPLIRNGIVVEIIVNFVAAWGE